VDAPACVLLVLLSREEVVEPKRDVADRNAAEPDAPAPASVLEPATAEEVVAVDAPELPVPRPVVPPVCVSPLAAENEEAAEPEDVVLPPEEDKLAVEETLPPVRPAAVLTCPIAVPEPERPPRNCGATSSANLSAAVMPASRMVFSTTPDSARTVRTAETASLPAEACSADGRQAKYSHAPPARRSAPASHTHPLPRGAGSRAGGSAGGTGEGAVGDGTVLTGTHLDCSQVLNYVKTTNRPPRLSPPERDFHLRFPSLNGDHPARGLTAGSTEYDARHG